MLPRSKGRKRYRLARKKGKMLTRDCRRGLPKIGAPLKGKKKTPEKAHEREDWKIGEVLGKPASALGRGGSGSRCSTRKAWAAEEKIRPRGNFRSIPQRENLLCRGSEKESIRKRPPRGRRRGERKIAPVCRTRMRRNQCRSSRKGEGGAIGRRRATPWGESYRSRPVAS